MAWIARHIALIAALVPGALGGLAPPASAAGASPWASVNVCDPPTAPGAVGVRVGMPAGPGTQWIRVRIEYYAAAGGRYVPAAAGGDGGWTRLGTGAMGVRGGTTFHFDVPAAGHQLILRGTVTLEWRRGGRTTRRARIHTHAGHAADAGGTSLAQCVVRR